MAWIQPLFVLIGAAAAAVLASLVFSSVREHNRGAGARSAVLLVLFLGAWFGSLALGVPAIVLLLASAALIAFAALFFLPVGCAASIRVDEIQAQVDERDVIFAREEYAPGSPQYEAYYARHPDKKAIDDSMRATPELLAPGGRFYDPIESGRIDSLFDVIRTLTTGVDGEIAAARTATDPARLSADIKALTRRLGAADVGIARLNPMFVYSHVGRGPERWGEPIRNDHRFAVAFTLEMDSRAVDTAPRLPITDESARQYLRGAKISVALAAYIRALGYPARAHIAGGNYQIMLPPVAHDAGLGELGRMGYLISPRFGARIRLGAVTTDMPLVPDQPIAFGVQDFCKRCKKCATNCPPAAIPAGEKAQVRGAWKWPLHIERCLRFWRIIGTDCGLCMRVCPYSHPPTFAHNLIRAGIRRSAFARTVSVWGDDLIYGRNVARGLSPEG